VVAFDNAVNREILGDLGVYAPQGDGTEFARQIGEILDDPVRMADLGCRGREHAVERLSWHRAASDLMELYGTVLADASPAYR